MSSTSLLALATLIVTGAGRAGDVAPGPTVVAIARSRIVSGVTLSNHFPTDADGRHDREPKPRERFCPKDQTTPCRLFVIDLP